MMVRIYIHRWFAMVAILNPKWPPKYKNPPYYGGYSYKVDHNMAPKPWISISNIKIYLETKFRQIGGFLYLAAILYLGYHGNGRLDRNNIHI
jgi:hypothetical protein